MYEKWKWVGDKCLACQNTGRIRCIVFYNPLADAYVTWCASLHLSLRNPGRHYYTTVYVLAYGKNFQVKLPAPYTFSTDRSLDYVLYRATRHTHDNLHGRYGWASHKKHSERKKNQQHGQVLHEQLIIRAESLKLSASSEKEYKWWTRFIRHVKRDPRMVGTKAAVNPRGCVSLARDTRRLWKREPLRLTRYMSSIGLDSVACKHMSARYLAKFEPAARMEFITGEDMRLGLLHSIGAPVCMSGPGASDYAAMYYENPDKVQMLVKNLRYERRWDVYDRDTLVPQGDCFAFVWTDDDGRRWLDNTYPRDETHDADYLEWARANNVIVIWDRLANDPWPRDAVITLRYPSTGRFPYIDNFCRADIYKGEKVVLHDDGDYELQFTDGSYEESMVCYNCAERLDPNEYYTVHHETYCEDCCHENFFQCEHCDGIYSHDEATTVNNCAIWCEYCAMNHAFTCHYCDTLCSGDYQLVRLAKGNVVISCGDCAEQHANYCENCGETVVKEDMHDSEVCSNCAPNEEDEHE